MCTVSFLPKPRGFYLAMNRDEKRSRPIALPPVIANVGDRRAILPREPNGGTWIAVNDAGICLALINWHKIERSPVGEITSRGQVTTALAGACSSDEIARAVRALTLRKLRPFRLIVVQPSEEVLTEWRWNLEFLAERMHPWQPKHWFSSGFDEATAELQRRRVCDAACKEPSTGNIRWLRRLHQSHAPKRGPFSICMHRANAVTVSYTEVAVSDQRVIMRYKNGPPCSIRSTITQALPLCKFSSALSTNC
jgi:hypothetical protein